MLTSLVLTVQTPQEVVLTRYLGRASHALFLRLIEARSPALSDALHNAPGPRPFTCSALVGGRPRGQSLYLETGQVAWLRYTGLTAEVSAHLLALAEDPPRAVELDGAPLHVVRATLDPAMHPWANRSSYEALVAEHLGPEAPAPRRLRLLFASPTTFRSQGVNIPLPLPHLVFGSLWQRWQAFAPVAVSEVQRYAAEMVALSRYRLRTHPWQAHEAGAQIGFVGEATFARLNADRYWGRVLALLAAYALYAGIGAHTTMGMGQARLAPLEAAERWAKSG
ncbi:MAG: CRISPR system precrRNA processing endoribonuclease RAMP protein Cas6 [Chloroflexi bacterium]|nr:CRISPR system precrRNA processing endoribonuclease RAMP protein Cas6 [Chloroflexota bacterium]